ncbi:hypothetical protein JP0101_14790 [Helicobacter pylori]|nr:hypothetical protein JP0101_14790 [Helicobacter pylori]
MLYHYRITINLFKRRYSFFIVFVYSPNNCISVIDNISIISYIIVSDRTLSISNIDRINAMPFEYVSNSIMI